MMWIEHIALCLACERHLISVEIIFSVIFHSLVTQIQDMSDSTFIQKPTKEIHDTVSGHVSISASIVHQMKVK